MYKRQEQTTKLNAELINRLDQLDRKAARRRGEERPDKRKGFGRGRGGKGAKDRAPVSYTHLEATTATTSASVIENVMPYWVSSE